MDYRKPGMLIPSLGDFVVSLCAIVQRQADLPLTGPISPLTKPLDCIKSAIMGLRLKSSFVTAGFSFNV